MISRGSMVLAVWMRCASRAFLRQSRSSLCCCVSLNDVLLLEIKCSKRTYCRWIFSFLNKILEWTLSQKVRRDQRVTARDDGIQPRLGRFCQTHVCYSLAGRSVLGETVHEVLSTARGRRPRAVLRPRAQFLPIRTDLGRWILHQNTNSSAVLTAFEYAAICCVFQTLRRKIVDVWKAT